MKTSISLKGIPETGIEMSFDDQSIWALPLKEFEISCQIIEPVHARLFLQQQAEGCLIKGSLEAKVELPCDSCGEPAVYKISAQIEEFEEHPNAVYTDEDGNEYNLNEEEYANTSLIYIDKYSNAHLDIASLLWEEFSLALPVKPLCKADCKGICTSCGVNKNLADCTCEKESTDPRFEKLKNLKITNK